MDLVLESTAGKVVGIEVKNSQTITGEDFRGLATLQKETGKDFHRGILLYGGEKQHSFGKNLWAVPIPALWAHE